MKKSTNTYIQMSYPLSQHGACPPAIPKLETFPYMMLDKDGANVSKAMISRHSGTHMDAPNHVIKDGLKITDFPIEEFVFDFLPKHLEIVLVVAAIVKLCNFMGDICELQA